MAARVARLVLQLSIVVAGVLTWEWAGDTERIERSTFGQPSLIREALQGWVDDGVLGHHVLVTLRVLALGMGLGMALGVLVGLAMGLSALTRDVIEPFVMFYNGMPRMILLPVVAVPLGFSPGSKVALVVLVTWVLTALNVAAGCAQLPPELTANTRLLGARWWHLALDVYAPSVFGWVLSSARTTFQFAFATAVFAEFSGAPEGLGYLVVLGQQTFRINQVMAALLVISLIGVAGNALLDVAERRISRWRPAAGT